MNSRPCGGLGVPRFGAVLAAAVLAAAALTLVGLARPALSADPTLRWYTITTPHFHVHTYRNQRHDLRQVAQQVAHRAEQAHRVLAPLLRHVPSSRTEVVVTDDTEGANGWAQIVPRNAIRVFATSPDPHSSLNDYDDWLYGLFVHEYTHILHIDTIHGVPRLINAIFGKTWAPNQIQPSWITEGFATYTETALTSGGRGRSTIYDMLLRSAVLEGRLLRLDQISSDTRLYPRGVARYLYGCRFVKYIVDRFGEDKLARLSHLYAGRPVPYALNRAARDVFGHTLVALYADFTRHLQRRYALQLAEVERRSVTPSERLTHSGEALSTLRYSPDGTELVYTADDGRRRRSHLVRDAASARLVQRLRDYGDHGVAITPDGRHLVHAQRERWRTFYDYADLYVRDRRTGQRRRLTHGLRATAPDVSPDGRLVAFVANDAGNHDLLLIPFEGGAHRVLLRGSRGESFSTPRFDRQGRRLVFSRWVAGGYRDIHVIDLASGAVRRLTADRAQDLAPVFSPDGQRVYFASDRTGIYNIHCHDLQTGELQQVTNVVGGAFWPAVGPRERTLYFAGYSAMGYDLHRMPLDRRRFQPALPHVSRRPDPVRIQQPARDYPVTRYSPWRTLLPQQWMLTLGSDSYGSTLGLDVQGNDIVRRHSYAVRTSFSLERGHPSYAVTYGYDRFWPTLRLDTTRAEGPRGGLTLDGERRSYIEENYGAGAALSLPVLRIPDHALSLSLGYRFNWFRDQQGRTEQVLVEPGELSPGLPRTGRLSGATMGVSYTGRVERYARSVSTERGRLISLNLRVDSEIFGSDYDTVQLTWAWTEYLPIPWFDQHVLALRLAGGIGRGDTARRGSFYLGGFPEQKLIDAVLEQAPLGGAYLRGYAPGSFFGEQYHLLNVEYRAPLFDIERGISSLPIYFNHLHLALFADLGNAFYGPLRPQDLNVGVGAELLLEWMISYYQGFTLRVGYARGLMDRGSNEFHVLLGNRY